MSGSKRILEYGKALLWAGGTVITGMAIAVALMRFLPKHAAATAPWSQIAGGFLILWSVLAQVGWKVETWGGNTRAERVDRWAFRILNLLGILALTVGVGLVLFGAADTSQGNGAQAAESDLSERWLLEFSHLGTIERGRRSTSGPHPA